MANPSYWPQVATVLLTIGGWVFVHQLSLRAQRINLRNQAVDRARLDISQALRDYQLWLADCNRSYIAVTMGLRSAPAPRDSRWNAVFDEMLANNSDRTRTISWALRMEEFEIVFPETRDVRLDLLERQRIVRQSLSAMHAAASKASLRGRGTDEELREMEECHDLCMLQQTLIEDLLVHLQNASLSALTGNSVPLRVPGEAGQPRIEKDRHSGRLVIRPTTEFRSDSPAAPRSRWSRVRNALRWSYPR